MKFATTSTLAAAAIALAIGSSSASAVTFTGSTTGCFGNGCSFGPLALTDQLLFAGNPFFNGSTTIGPLTVNLGGFAISDPTGLFRDFNDSYNNQVFNLRIDFTAPAGTSPDPVSFSATLAGDLNWINGGTLKIDFGAPKHFTFNGGAFDLAINDVTLTTKFLQHADAEFLTGTFSNVVTSGNAQTPAVPEPSTWAMIILGFAGVGVIGYRRRQQAQVLAV